MKTCKKMSFLLLLATLVHQNTQASTDFTEQERTLFQDLQTVTNKDKARAFLARRGITVNNVGATGVTLAFQLNQAIQEALNDNEKKAHERLAEAQKNLNTLQRSTDDPFAGIITQRIINLAKNQVQTALQLKAGEKLAQQLEIEKISAAQQQKLQAEKNAAAAKIAQEEADDAAELEKLNIKEEAKKMAEDAQQYPRQRIEKIENNLKEYNISKLPQEMAGLITQIKSGKKKYLQSLYDIAYANTLLRRNFPFATPENKKATEERLAENKKTAPQFYDMLTSIEQQLAQAEAQIQNAGNQARLDAKKSITEKIDNINKLHEKGLPRITTLDQETRDIINNLIDTIKNYIHTFALYSQELAKIEEEIKVGKISTATKDKTELYKKFIGIYNALTQEVTTIFDVLADNQVPNWYLISEARSKASRVNHYEQLDAHGNVIKGEQK